MDTFTELLGTHSTCRIGRMTLDLMYVKCLEDKWTSLPTIYISANCTVLHNAYLTLGSSYTHSNEMFIRDRNDMRIVVQQKYKGTPGNYSLAAGIASSVTNSSLLILKLCNSKHMNTLNRA